MADAPVGKAVEVAAPILDPSISKEFAGSLNSVLTSTSDIASTQTTVLTEITKLGDLKALGLCNSNPVGFVEHFLEAVYVHSGLPWWGTIVLTTVIIRIALFPIVLKTQRNAAKIQNLKPVLEPLNAELQASRKANDSAKMQVTMRKMQQVYKDAGCSPFAGLWGLAQAPVFLSFFFALRAMAELPVPGFDSGGLWFVKDLTLMDPTYILPVIASCTMLVVMEAVFMYWVPSNFFTLAQILLLRDARIKKALAIPLANRELAHPKSQGMSAFSPPSLSQSFQSLRALKKKPSLTSS
ncbi:Mitochondrial inner membrane protein oxa1l [Phlyctochytrium planicorne]|nr:Mitochondrial inner membrane protein oxa1l [Phlyctochytrium planicorne]